MKIMLAGIIGAALLVGCVVTPTRNGQYSFGFIDPGASVAQFQSAGGNTRLRRHLDGTYSLYFPDRFNQYRMGRHDEVRLVTQHSSGGKTGALFELRDGTCSRYELLTITADQVGRNRLSTNCGTRLEAFVQNDELIVREQAQTQPRFWAWTPAGVRSGRMPPPARTPAPAVAAERRATPAASTRPAPRPQSTGAATSSASRPATAPPRAAKASSPIVMPTGSIATQTEPTEIVDLTGAGN